MVTAQRKDNEIVEPVAEVRQSENGSVYLDWQGRTMADFVGAKLYTHPKELAGVDLHTALRRAIFDTYMRMWSKTYPTKPDGTSDHDKMLAEVLAKLGEKR